MNRVGLVVSAIGILTGACATSSAPTARAPAAPAPAPAATAPLAPAPTYKDLVGSWQGVMNEGRPSAIAAEVTLARLPTGEYVGRVVVPSQGADLRASAIALNGDALRFEIKQVGGVFEGTVNPARTVANGKWTQPGMDAPAPIVFRRVAGAAPDAPATKPVARRGIDRLPRTPAPFTMPLTVRVHGRPNVLHSHGASYLVYELEIANMSSAEVTIQSLDVIAQERTVARIAGAALEDVLAQIGRDNLVNARLPGGASAVAFLWLRFDKPADVPR
jgi:hypothetical protein